MKLYKLFADSFDTFKVFDNLTPERASLINHNSPKSVWQIINHLIIWQDYQINLLTGNHTQDINETETWLAIQNISVFLPQITQIKRV